MRLDEFTAFIIIIHISVVASKIRKTTLKPENCPPDYPFVRVDITEAAILHFPANLSSELECDIFLIASAAYQVWEFKVNPSRSIACGFGWMTSPNGLFEPHDLCETNTGTRSYRDVMLTLSGFTRSPEFSLIMTPTLTCGLNDNVSCCFDAYYKRMMMPSAIAGAKVKDFAILCDAQRCIERVYVCDGVPNCVDGADEGEMCDVSDVASGGRVNDVVPWVVAAAFSLLSI